MELEQELLLSVSEFVALTNQTLEFAYPSVVVQGELANFRVSKNRWVYFDLKDDEAIVRFFGTIYNLPGPLEDGMLLKVRGQPRLHPQFGFSITVQTIQPSGEGTIKRAAQLLEKQLAAEGLFDLSRKRSLPYPPERIGLITSRQSAAYADFTKILDARWPGLEVQFIDVQVQGEQAPTQIVAALQHINALPEPPEIVIIIRGGGSSEDLAAFSSETVTRAVATSRVPTMVAIGHEIDLSLAELAADSQASTPSNAAELLVPDRAAELRRLTLLRQDIGNDMIRQIRLRRSELAELTPRLLSHAGQIVEQAKQSLSMRAQLLAALSPRTILQRGYAIVRDEAGRVVRTTENAKQAGIVNITFADGPVTATVNSTKARRNNHGQ